MTALTRNACTVGYVARYRIIVSLIILLPKFSSATDYVFTVRTTKACPKNQVEMNERSLALNCTKDNGYTCLPDENLTVLLEFCYKRARIAVPKGYCLFLRYSDVDAYDCKRFNHGCPDADYYSDEIYKYPYCVSIGSGCFLADASCDKIPAADRSSVTTNSNDLDKITTLDDRVWILPLGVLIPMCSAICIVYIIHKKKSAQRQRRKDRETYIEIRKKERENKNCSSDYVLEMDQQSIFLDHTDDLESSPLHTVSGSSSFQNEFTPLYNTFEQRLDSRVAPSLNGIAYQHEPNDIVQSSLDTTADVRICDRSGYSPSISGSMSGHDTTYLKQRDRRTRVKQIPIQSCMYCML